MLGKVFLSSFFKAKKIRTSSSGMVPISWGHKDCILINGSLDFDLTQDVPSAVSVWVRLPHLPLHCWNQESLVAIGNTLGKFIDVAKRRDQYSCALIYVEVDIEVGLPKAIKIIVVDWSHI